MFGPSITNLSAPEALQLAIYIGWLLHGVAGGLVAGVLFVLPSIFILLGLSAVYAVHGSLPLVAAALSGLKPVVVAIVLEAVPRTGRRARQPPAQRQGIEVGPPGAQRFPPLHERPVPLLVAGDTIGPKPRHQHPLFHQYVQHLVEVRVLCIVGVEQLGTGGGPRRQPAVLQLHRAPQDPPRRLAPGLVETGNGPLPALHRPPLDAEIRADVLEFEKSRRIGTRARHGAEMLAPAPILRQDLRSQAAGTGDTAGKRGA